MNVGKKTYCRGAHLIKKINLGSHPLPPSTDRDIKLLGTIRQMMTRASGMYLGQSLRFIGVRQGIAIHRLKNPSQELG